MEQTKVRRFPGNNKDIENVAGEIRRLIEPAGGERLAAKPLLQKLLERTGGKVVVVDDPTAQEAEGGSLEIRGKNDYTVFLSPFTTPLRDNFTLGHEIGHYILHFLAQKEAPPTPPVWFHRYGTDPMEWQANRFSAALLMPHEEFRKKHKEFAASGGLTMELLSGYFDVSLPAIEVRAKSLGLI